MPRMDIWDIRSLDVQPQKPQVLRSDDDARVIAINLPAGEELGEHEVHEHAYLFVADGELELSQDGETTTAGAGTVAHWVPQERHELRATRDSRLVLLLAPWPGAGHPSIREERSA
jgi:quercetin dioxygenase-like cupin family protein